MSRGTRPAFRDNTRLILTGIAALAVLLVALLAIASRSAELSPGFLTEFVLYALSATNLAMLAVLGVVLARNVIKLVVERRRALPFARFRGKLVAGMLGMALVPALLVLLVGSEIIRNSVDRWFNAPMDEVLQAATGIAGDYYQEQQRLAGEQASATAQTLVGVDLDGRPDGAHRIVEASVRQGRAQSLQVFRIRSQAGDPVLAELVTEATDRMAPATPALRSSAARLAEQAASSGDAVRAVEVLPSGGELVRVAVPVRTSAAGPIRGAVVASVYLTGQFASRARRAAGAYEAYQQLRVLKQPLAGVYQSFFLLLTLLILVGATWMGLYLAKRITRPVQRLAEAAREIGAGHLDYRVEPQGNDEFGALTDAFNRMATELAASRARLEREQQALALTHHEVEARRRYVETVLDRIGSGVIALDAEGRIRAWNAAASRLLGIEPDVSGRPAAAVFGTDDLRPLVALLGEAVAPVGAPRPHELALAREGRSVHLSVVTTPLQGQDGTSEGVVAVVDDVSALMRAQKVAAWRELARRLAHEIKNPLTPIRLCAERLDRHFAGAPDATRALVAECTGAIVGAVETLTGLVDEFSQFARMPPPRVVPTDLPALVAGTLALYDGLFPGVTFHTECPDELPPVPLDPDQIRRVLVNLVDNSIEAVQEHGALDVTLARDPARRAVRITVADDGRGIAPEDRDAVFLPYYSTKQRGSGLGLAIVHRIVVEHGGTIEVTAHEPRGTRFIMYLPC